jgi:hypothetical protein
MHFPEFGPTKAESTFCSSSLFFPWIGILNTVTFKPGKRFLLNIIIHGSIEKVV